MVFPAPRLDPEPPTLDGQIERLRVDPGQIYDEFVRVLALQQVGEHGLGEVAQGLAQRRHVAAFEPGGEKGRGLGRAFPNRARRDPALQRKQRESPRVHSWDEARKLDWQAALRVACRGRGKPTKAAVPPGSHTDLAQNAGIRPANSHVGMPVCDGRWSVASGTPRLQSWEKSGWFDLLLRV